VKFVENDFWLILQELIFPQSCLACDTGLIGRRDISFCQTCLEGVRLLREPFCTICSKPFVKSSGENHFCSYCLSNRWYFTRARAVVHYDGPIAEAVKMFKYNGKMYVLETFTALTIKHFQDSPIPKPDLIIPVPLHAKRLRQRGFNQALVLGRKFFPQYKKIIDPYILARHKLTTSQTGLSGMERRKNVSNAFKVKRPEKVRDKKILLVDDVFTTGTTVNECARTLMEKGAGAVEVFTFARVND
jgi:ComF family protein